MRLGDKDDSYVELLHQICGTNETWLRCVMNFNQKHASIIRSVKLGQNPKVVKRKEQVRVNTMRKFKDVEKMTGRRMSQEDKNKAIAKTKKERRDNFADGNITLG
jgi:benzoyl-CoA reductase/2-hydroxyglutaryl-CoA dehydratase subunit BcrC/BadD/HgdB